MTRRVALIGSLALIALTTVLAQAAIKGWRAAIIAAGLSLGALVVGTRLLGRLRAMRLPGASPFDRATSRIAVPQTRPADLVAIERSFGWKSYDPEEFEQRIKPQLVRAHRLVVLERYSVVPGSDPERFYSGPLHVLRADVAAPERTVTADLVAIVEAIEGV